MILRTPHMPSVLLEAGSIVNRDEELLMATEEHQLQIAGAVTEAVEHLLRAEPQPEPRKATTSTVIVTRASIETVAPHENR